LDLGFASKCRKQRRSLRESTRFFESHFGIELGQSTVREHLTKNGFSSRIGRHRSLVGVEPLATISLDLYLADVERFWSSGVKELPAR
jgi:hypothetical protein